MKSTDVRLRNNVRVVGPADGPAVVLVQGFGCDQVVWDRLVPHLEGSHRLVLFDHAGTGGADIAAYDPVKYSSLGGYTADLTEILDVLSLRDATIVGHTVGGMTALAAAAAGHAGIGRLVLLGTSPCYANLPEAGYFGGFSRDDMEEILAAAEGNFPLWAASSATALVGDSAPAEISAELAERLCRLHPSYVRDFLRMSLHSDVRHLLPEVRVPVTILQAAADPLTPAACSQYLFDFLPQGELIHLKAKGNMPHLSAPEEIARVLQNRVPRATHVNN